jgi:hypothetical protein
MNDESIARIEELLTSVDLRADESEQTKILLACGRAEGRAELQRTLRRWKAGAAALSALSVCLLAGLVLRARPSGPDAPSQVVEKAVARGDRSRADSERTHRRVAPIDKLHVATDWSHFPQATPRAPQEPDEGGHLHLPHRSTLMASSRIDLQEFSE